MDCCFSAKNMGTNIKKYSKIFFDHAKQSGTNPLKTPSKIAIKKQ